jgi:hypothetical protein
VLPLEFPTEAQAADYFRTHGDEWGRPYRVVGFGAVTASGPPRPALGYNAAGVWVWADEAEGQWP